MRVIIVGAGIGGLTLARSLAAARIDFVVLEQAPRLLAVGAGIQLSPNGVRVLHRLDLAEGLARVGVRPRAHEFRDWRTGETLLRTPLGPEAEAAFGAPYFHAHRADLLDLLLAGLEPSRLVLDRRVVSVAEHDGLAAVVCANGERYDGDVVVGADGVHSVVRDTRFRPEPPRRSGYLAWRGLVARDRVAGLGFEESSYIYLGPRMSLVLYFVSGGAALNWIAIGQSEDRKRESWSQTATRDEIAGCFGGWHAPARRLVAATEQPFVTALYDREPLAEWIRERVVLLGDACHAMLPYHAQGAVQSIEDAWVLARCLELEKEPESALSRYQSLRKGRADRVAAQSRHAESSYHLEDPAAVAARNARLRAYAERGSGFTPQQAWLFGYDAELAVTGADAAWRALPSWGDRNS